jgi:hypothetical protein
MPFYQKGDIRIRYEEAGSGFPLLVTPGGGLNSCVTPRREPPELKTRTIDRVSTFLKAQIAMNAAAQ